MCFSQARSVFWVTIWYNNKVELCWIQIQTWKKALGSDRIRTCNPYFYTYLMFKKSCPFLYNKSKYKTWLLGMLCALSVLTRDGGYSFFLYPVFSHTGYTVYNRLSQCKSDWMFGCLDWMLSGRIFNLASGI